MTDALATTSIASLKVGTRGSPLALVQTREFMATLGRYCDSIGAPRHFIETEIGVTGDAVQNRKLAEIGGKGLFAKEIHEALTDGRIDLAVHSLKDLETEMPPGLLLGCVLKREDPRDGLVLRAGAGSQSDPFAALPQGAVIGTCSVRRQAQLLHVRPDLRIVDMRGNVNTRMAKLERGECEATLLAIAGLNRMGWSLPNAVPLDPRIMVPAAAQGIIGITVRAADTALVALLAAIDDPHARAVSNAERSLLATLDGSCQTPIGGFADVDSGTLRLTGLVARMDGSFLARRELSGPVADAARIGAALGAELRAACPADVLA
jgi:hydroxymethylbilane synthase